MVSHPYRGPGGEPPGALPDYPSRGVDTCSSVASGSAAIVTVSQRASISSSAGTGPESPSLCRASPPFRASGQRGTIRRSIGVTVR